MFVSLSHRGSFYDVSPNWLFPRALAEVQQVFHHHLTYEVMSGEAVEVVDGEVELARVQLGQGHAKLERLIKNRVESFSVHLRTRDTESPSGNERKWRKLDKRRSWEGKVSEGSEQEIG